MTGKVSSCWLTINRGCNLNCSWCYAKNAKSNDMKLSDAYKIIDFLPQIGVTDLILIGGEPTVYKDLNQVLLFAKKHNIDTGVVTNGVKLKDRDFLSKLIDSGASHFGISQKGFDRNSYYQTTSRDAYEDVLTAISNLSETGIPFSVSFVLTKENIPSIHLGIIDAINAGAKRVRLSFCYDFEACRSDVCAVENPYALAKLFEENYGKINAACSGNFGLFQSMPFCVWDRAFIDLLDRRNQLTSVCQVLQKSGLVIDTDLSIIPCNAMYDFVIGKFGVDFSDSSSFEQYWNGDQISKFYNKLRALPDASCAECDLCINCGGGCISNWFNYSFSQLKIMGQALERTPQ